LDTATHDGVVGVGGAGSMIEDGRAGVVGCMVLDASMLLGDGVWLVWFVC